MVFSATFNNTSVISRMSVLLLAETRVRGENHRPATSHWQLYYITLHWLDLAWVGFKFPTIVMICIACIGSYKSNYYTNTTSTSPNKYVLTSRRLYENGIITNHTKVRIYSSLFCHTLDVVNASLGFILIIHKFFSTRH